jgi:hypothetical protein
LKSLGIIKRITVIMIFAQSAQTFALPIEWGGSLGYESSRINNYRHAKNDPTSAAGSQGVDGSTENAFLQSYVFRLNPNMVVNDHVSLKGEFATGDVRGGLLGDNTSVTATTGQKGAGNYYQTRPAGQSSLNVNQLYMEIYSETATYRVGRFSRNWGLGALINSGDEVFNRFFSYYEGVEAKLNLGKFYITPYWSTLDNGDDNTRNGEVKEMGVEVLYDNPDKDMKLGAHLSKRKSGGDNSLYFNDVGPGEASTGSFAQGVTSVKLMDFFFERYFGKFKFGLEIPVVSGDFGNVYAANKESEVSATAYLFETSYEFNSNWTVDLDFGMISGDDGNSDTFEAIYLHPNFQLAEIMFRYNIYAVQDSRTANPFESSWTNAQYLKIAAHYTTGLWKWHLAYIMATANETAESGKRAYHHERGYAFNANKSQSDDYGFEIDSAFDYQWNPNLVLSGYAAYFKVGDYYAYSNASPGLDIANELAFGLRLGLKF